MRTIQIKRGTAANTPTLADGELGLQTDAGKLVVGNGGENLGVTMDKEMTKHKNDRGNPHGVTADQVGARPNTWVPSKADVGLGSVDNTADRDKSVNYANSAGTASNANAVGGRAASTVLSEIDNLKTSVANGKAQIASAISDKGVSTGAGADFGTMANNIRAIATGNEVMAGEWPDFSLWHGSGGSFTIPTSFSARAGTIKFYGRTNIQISGTSRNAAVVGNICYRGNDGSQQGQLYISQSGSNLIITVSDADRYDYYNLYGVFVKL